MQSACMYWTKIYKFNYNKTSHLPKTVSLSGVQTASELK